jgi:hypothetical protein
MPAGAQKQIAAISGYSCGYVSAVLNGYRSQTNAAGINIIRLAADAAGREYSKRFFKR